jgi:hypothetical protein
MPSLATALFQHGRKILSDFDIGTKQDNIEQCCVCVRERDGEG